MTFPRGVCLSIIQNIDPSLLKHVLAGNIVHDKAPNILQILGLGSCVAISFYHQKTQIGIMAHVVLPAREKDIALTPNLRGKYANIAVEELISWAKRNKIPTEELTIKLVGGAKMFKNSVSDVLNISDRNVESITQELAKYKLKANKTELGGNKGRSIFFHLDTGEIKIFHAGGKLKEII